MRTDKKYRVLFLVNKYNQNENTWLCADSSEQINRMISERLAMMPSNTWWKAIVFNNTGNYTVTENMLKQATAIVYRQNVSSITFVSPNHNWYLTNLGVFYLGKQQLIKNQNEVSK